MNGTTHCRIPEQADSHAGIPIYELFRAVSLPSPSRLRMTSRGGVIVVIVPFRSHTR